MLNFWALRVITSRHRSCSDASIVAYIAVDFHSESENRSKNASRRKADFLQCTSHCTHCLFLSPLKPCTNAIHIVGCKSTPHRRLVSHDLANLGCMSGVNDQASTFWTWTSLKYSVVLLILGAMVPQNVLGQIFALETTPSSQRRYLLMLKHKQPCSSQSPVLQDCRSRFCRTHSLHLPSRERSSPRTLTFSDTKLLRTKKFPESYFHDFEAFLCPLSDREMHAQPPQNR